jgi:nucleotide-binding universal stress UspA family protein
VSESLAPIVRSVFHPTELAPKSGSAFAHALAIALARKSRLTILHPRGKGRSPRVRNTLEQWGLLEADCPRAAVYGELSLRVKKVERTGRTPLAASARYLRQWPADLIVLGARRGHWMRRSGAERLARRAKTMTLFLPPEARGFVSTEAGSVTLRRVLVPMAKSPDPTATIRCAARTAAMAEGERVRITLLHVGDGSRMPRPVLPEADGVEWNIQLCLGSDVVGTILRVARERGADLIAMASAGPRGVLESLRGSLTERVVRRAPCPVLAVPL